MPLQQNERLNALKKLKAEKKPDREDDIVYKGEKRRMQIFQIPFDYLIFNKYNGRILSMTKSYERQYHELDPSKEEDAKTISDFLWESKPDRNRITKADLFKWGQKRYGIVTQDGVIVDGNRRASLLIRNYKENPTKCQSYFLAVILDDVLDGVNSRDIMQLETTYQMGEDEKLGYDPIQKYLKCKQLIENGFEVKDIAEMMGESKSRVKEWLDILELMDEYLEGLEYDGIYTRLDKREGQFVDLNKYLKKYENGTDLVKWPYDKEEDINELRIICFDYIRAQYEGKEFRSIAKPGKDSFFCKEEVWKKFKDEHFDEIEPINDEDKSIDELREEHPGEPLSKLLKIRDDNWTLKAAGKLKGNLNKSVRLLEDVNEKNEPIILLSRAIGTLEQINPEIPGFYDKQEVDPMLLKVNEIIWEFKKIIKEKRRENGDN